MAEQRKGGNVKTTAAAAAAADQHRAAAAAGKDEEKKKDVLKRERTLLDDALTVIFLLLVGAVFYHVRDDRDGMIFLIACLAGVAVVIFLSKLVSRAIGSFISEHVLNTSWTPVEDRRPLRKRQTMKKFTDQAWQLVIHSSMAAAEYYIVFYDTDGAPENNFFDNTSHCWFWKKQGIHHSENLQMFYVVQLSIWIVTCFSHRFVEARHKDYYQMYVHHIATIALIAGSWINEYLRIGVLVLLLHDASDVPLDLTKMFNYLKLQGVRGFFMSELFFVINLVSWVYFRLYLYPTKALYSAFFESPIQGQGLSGAEFGALPLSEKLQITWINPGAASANTLLNVLLVLHVFWFYLLCRIAVKIAFGKKTHEVGEEEYEGQSTDNDED